MISASYHCFTNYKEKCRPTTLLSLPIHLHSPYLATRHQLASGQGSLQPSWVGHVDRVDIVKRRDDNQPFCRIFVHMRYWPIDNPEIADWRETLLRGDSIKVVHSAPWFWKCVASNLPRPESRNNASVPYVLTDTTPSAAAVAASTRASTANEDMAEEV